MTQDLHPTLDHLRQILDRDLRVLRDEVDLTPDAHLWEVPDGVRNAVGTLAIHLCGNLSHFIGHVLGGSDDQRDIDAEFSGTPLPRTEVLDRIEATREVVWNTLSGLDAARLDDPMPRVPPHHQGRTVHFFLIQLCCHFSRHLGQLHYLRRMLG